MDTRGQHLLLDIWLEENQCDRAVERLTQFIETRFHVVARSEFRFEPYGLTRVLILSESHFSIHTYPEHNFVSVDLYICTPGLDMNQLREELLSDISMTRSASAIFARGVPQPVAENCLYQDNPVPPSPKLSVIGG